jgi:hypothetical protein
MDLSCVYASLCFPLLFLLFSPHNWNPSRIALRLGCTLQGASLSGVEAAVYCYRADFNKEHCLMSYANIYFASLERRQGGVQLEQKSPKAKASVNFYRQRHS